MFRETYFGDGYTQPGFIAAVPRLHGAVRFTYRPALVEERSQLADAARQLKSSLYDRHVALFSAEKLVFWDVVDSRGRQVPISAEALLRLHPELFVKLNRIVLGWIPSDIDPAWPPETSSRIMDEETAAALTGGTVGDVRAERDEKN